MVWCDRLFGGVGWDGGVVYVDVFGVVDELVCVVVLGF